MDFVTKKNSNHLYMTIRYAETSKNKTFHML